MNVIGGNAAPDARVSEAWARRHSTSPVVAGVSGPVAGSQVQPSPLADDERHTVGELRDRIGDHERSDGGVEAGQVADHDRPRERVASDRREGVALVDRQVGPVDAGVFGVRRSVRSGKVAGCAGSIVGERRRVVALSDCRTHAGIRRDTRARCRTESNRASLPAVQLPESCPRDRLHVADGRDRGHGEWGRQVRAGDRDHVGERPVRWQNVGHRQGEGGAAGTLVPCEDLPRDGFADVGRRRLNQGLVRRQARELRCDGDVRTRPRVLATVGVGGIGKARVAGDPGVVAEAGRRRRGADTGGRHEPGPIGERDRLGRIETSRTGCST